MKSAAYALAVAASLALAAPAMAQRGATDPNAIAAEEQEAEALAAWTKRLGEARARLDAAERELAELEGAKGRGAHRRYPRGEAKGKYLERLDAARSERDAAARALPELLEEARRAGVPNGVLSRYEESEAYDDGGAEPGHDAADGA
ncbi:MAG: hypothetical protein DCC71_20820 [Proteobacteria bacterium]|nr:MAG: hypothetical protein DCC71_20820 [Pseudomonadota bacterium]